MALPSRNGGEKGGPKLVMTLQEDLTGATGSIRIVEYDGEKWVNLCDLKELVTASKDRWRVEGNSDSANTMDRFGATLGIVLG